MTDTQIKRHRLPVLPLRDAVLFPGVSVPVVAGRAGTLKAIEAAAASEEKLIFAVSQRENVEEARPEVLHTTGTVARIGQIQRGLTGVHVLLHGEARATVLQYAEGESHIEAVVQELSDFAPLDPDDAAFQALFKEVGERAAELGKRTGLGEEMVRESLDGVSHPGAFADLLAGYIDVTPNERQALLETLGVEERLRRVLIHIEHQLQMLEAQEDIQSKVKEEIGERQREYFLREQLKTIRKELGEDEEEKEKDELKERLEELELPEEARKEVERELSRLNRTPAESSEAQVIRTYLETVAELPWNERAEEDLDVEHAANVLDEDHYGLQDVKDRVLEFIAVHRLRKMRAVAELEQSDESESGKGDGNGDAPGASNPAAKSSNNGEGRTPTLLFLGPPGVGKTSIAKSIARAMGRPYVRVSLGGARDEADIRGHRRTYVGAMPGRLLQGMKQAGAKNPVFVLDELDKLGVSFQGDPASALLEVLDPAQNNSFVDHYIGVPFDLSEVLFIATGNFVQSIPGPLLDRMEVVEFAGYTEAEKRSIARQYLLPRQLRGAGLAEEQLEIDDDAMHEVVSGYTRESGVRQLERELGRVCRKVARKIAAGETESVQVDAGQIRELLGRPRVHPEQAAKDDQVGVATGMYYTPVGGDIMFVEASIMAGRGDLILTGQLGDVMKESARAAFTWAKSHAEDLGITKEMLEDKDIHIHVPAGAVPKDGPSAGVAMATAMISALSKVPVRNDVAMTGELTLSGRVLPIGGVKEKVLGAIRAGIYEVLLPKENLADMEDLSEEERARIKVHAVEDLGEAMELVLRKG